MSLILRPPGHLGVTLLLLRREAAARLTSSWFYGVASIVCVIAWVYGASFAQTFETESVLVTTDPLMALNVLVVVFLGVVLGLRLASSIAWEREHRTLEVLIVGPVLHETVVLAKFCVELCVLALLMAIYVLYLALAQPLGAGVIGVTDVFAAGRMPLHALPLLALGLLISACARTVRGAVLVYLAVTVILGLFEVVLGVLAARSPEELSLAAAYLRTGMQGIAPMVKPVSAVARLADLAQGLTASTPLAVSRTLMALALTAATLALAALVARARGAVA